MSNTHSSHSRRVHFGSNTVTLFSTPKETVSLARLITGGDCYTWDIRSHPTQIPPEQWGAQAFNPPLQRVTLVCEQLPWNIVIKNPNGVTVGDVLMGVHSWLLTPIAEPHKLRDDVRYNLDKAYHHNMHPGAPGVRNRVNPGYLWIDFLGRQTVFRGLINNSRFLESRGLPGDAVDVWAFELVERPVQR